MSLTDEQCRAMEMWAEKNVLEKISALCAENAKLKARAEAAEEVIGAQENYYEAERMGVLRYRIIEFRNILQTALAKWEALK